MSGRSRNALCPCGSGRKLKRCCADALEDPRRIAREHDAVGSRIQAWAFEHHGEAMRDAFAQITSGYTDRVLGDIDVQLIASWMLNDCQLPDGGTTTEQYALRSVLARRRGASRPRCTPPRARSR